MCDRRQTSLNFSHEPAHFGEAVSRGEDHLKVRVKAKPGASKLRPPKLVDVGNGSWAVEISVREAAVDGRANAALLDAMAQILDVPKSRVTLTSGATSKLKIFKIAGDVSALYVTLANAL